MKKVLFVLVVIQLLSTFGFAYEEPPESELSGRLTSLLLSVVDDPLDELNSSARQAIFAKAGLLPLDADRAEIQQAVERVIATRLNWQQRCRLFERKNIAPGPLAPLFVTLWKELVSNHRSIVAWDFQFGVELLSNHRDRFVFDGLSHHIVAKADAGELVTTSQLIAELLLTLKPADIDLLPLEFRERTASDTNTPNPNSRLEIIDFLTDELTRTRYAPWAKTTVLDTLGVQALVRSAVQHILVPDSYPPAVVLSKAKSSSPPGEGKDVFYLFCAGEPLVVGGDPFQGTKGDLFIGSITLPERDLRDRMINEVPLTFQCGKKGGTLTANVERLRVPLINPEDENFEVGPDRKIKAVVSFQILSDIGKHYLEKLKLGVISQGYRLIEESLTTDMQNDFLTELSDSDFYFPLNFHTNGDRFYLGPERCGKMRLQKETDGVTAELVLYFPPVTPTTGRDYRPAYVSAEDLTGLFKKRRTMEEIRRLTVMNIKCKSNVCVPQWTRVYKLSLPAVGGEEAKDLTNLLAPEVPVVIGSDQSFASNTVDDLIKNSTYPFKAIDLAVKGRPIKELISFLRINNFMPASNTSSKDHFDVAAQEKNLTLTIQLLNGEKIVL
jgi:hypothetical protein